MILKAIKLGVSIFFFLFSLIGNKAFALSSSSQLLNHFCNQYVSTVEQKQSLTDAHWSKLSESLETAILGEITIAPEQDTLRFIQCRKALSFEFERANFLLGAKRALSQEFDSAQSEALDKDSFSGASERNLRLRRYQHLWAEFLRDLRLKVQSI